MQTTYECLDIERTGELNGGELEVTLYVAPGDDTLDMIAVVAMLDCDGDVTSVARTCKRVDENYIAIGEGETPRDLATWIERDKGVRAFARSAHAIACHYASQP